MIMSKLPLTQTGKITHFTSPVKDIAMFGTVIYTATEDGSISVKNTEKGDNQKPKHLKAHKQEITSLSISPNEFFMASSSIDNTIKLWNLNDLYNPKHTTIKSHTACVRDCSFSPDSQLLISASDDKTAKIFQVHGQKFLTTLRGHTNWLSTAEFCQSSSIMAITGGTDRKVIVWDIAKRTPITVNQDHRSKVTVTRFFNSDNCNVISVCKC